MASVEKARGCGVALRAAPLLVVVRLGDSLYGARYPVRIYPTLLDRQQNIPEGVKG